MVPTHCVSKGMTHSNARFDVHILFSPLMPSSSTRGIATSVVMRSALFLALICVSSRSNSQPSVGAGGNTSSFRHFGTSDGLSEGRITCMLQDSKGFIWIGTFFGLNKYDGYSFKHYYATPHDAKGLQSNIITALCEDSSHTVWVGTRGGGLYALDRRTGNFRHYGHDSTNHTSLSSNDVAALLCDSKGWLWVATSENGLNYFDRSRSSFVTYEYPDRVSWYGRATGVMMLFESQRGTIIISGHGRPAEFDPQTGQLSDLIFEREGMPWFVTMVWPFGRGPGWFLVKAANGSRPKLFSTVRLQAFENAQSWGLLAKGSQPCFVLSGAFGGGDTGVRSSALLGTSRGLFILDSADHSIKPFLVTPQAVGNSYDNVYTCAMRDAEGRLWIGSFNGLYVLNKDALIFKKHLFQVELKAASNTPQTVRSLYVDHQGTLLAGTLSGQVFSLSGQDNEFHLSASPSVLRGSNPINGMTEDPLGNTWFATTAGPFFLRPAGRSELTRITFEISHNLRPRSSSQLRNEPIKGNPSGYVVYCDRESRIWLGSGVPKDHVETLRSYDTRTGEFLAYTYPGSETGHSGMHGVYALLEDRQNDFWIGTADGLFKLDRTTRQFTSFLYNPADEHSLNHNAIATLYEDSHGRLWVGTWGGGLDLMDRKSGQFTHFMEKDGLPSNIIYSILEDKTGSLWMATGRGISHFDPDLRTFSNYDLEDGLLDNEFQPNAAAMLPSGEMFFGGNHGVTSFFPERVTQKSKRPPLAITSFAAAYAPFASELVDGDSVQLNYDQNDLSFEFASLDYSSPQKKRYAYMLEGADHGWMHCGSRNSGSYSNLPPGHYVLRINSADAAGVWDARGIGIDIVIASPFWGTWWFQLLVTASAFSLLLVWVIRRRARDRAYQQMLDHALENERMNIAGELHDGPLQDLYATRFLLEEVEATDAEEHMHDALGDILKKVRGDLRAVTGELQLPRFEFGLAEDLAQFLESFGEQNPNIRIVSEIPIDGDARSAPTLAAAGTLPLKVKQNIFRIFRTALANVKKHSEASVVSVQYSHDGVNCSLEIMDNGRGFDVPSAMGQGTRPRWALAAPARDNRYGLVLMQAYALEIGAKLNIVSAPGSGTRIHVTYLNRTSFLKRYILRRGRRA